MLSQNLGVECLRIDSLCILQDSTEDWIRESSIMGDIYARSYCNIAASESRNPDSGCMHDGELSLTQPLVVNPSWNSSDCGYYAVRDWNFIKDFEYGPL